MFKLESKQHQQFTIQPSRAGPSQVHIYETSRQPSSHGCTCSNLVQSKEHQHSSIRHQHSSIRAIIFIPSCIEQNKHSVPQHIIISTQAYIEDLHISHQFSREHVHNYNFSGCVVLPQGNYLPKYSPALFQASSTTMPAA